MRKMRLFHQISFITLATIGFSTTAFAVAPLPEGFYLEANGGSSQSSDANYGPNSSYSGSGIGWNVNGGYKFIPFFATEVGYTHYASTEVKNGAGVKAATDDHYSYGVAGKGILPISDSGFELFAKLGVSWLHSQVNVSNTAAANSIPLNRTGTQTVMGVYLGAGGEYFLTPSIPINLQWAMAKGDDKTGNQNLYSIGLAYLFDKA